MSDIVHRLRRTASLGIVDGGLMDEAASEIERLRNAIKNCPPVAESEYVRRLENEVKQLRAGYVR